MHILGDESLYLNDDGIFLRELIYLNRDEYLEDVKLENNKYASLINLYNTYISKISNLVSELEIKDNQISTIQVITKLLFNGVFSYDEIFKTDSGIKDILVSRNGINVIDGTCCCRNVTDFVKDIMGIDEYPCVISHISDKHLAKEKEVNHTMNLVYYKGIPYGFDVCNNGNLYKMISEFEMIPFDDKKRYYTHYKPYYDMIYNGKSLSDIKTTLEYYKQVCGNYISKEEYEEIIELASIRLKSRKSLIYDFKNDTKDLMFELKSQIEEVKGMRK